MSHSSRFSRKGRAQGKVSAKIQQLLNTLKRTKRKPLTEYFVEHEEEVPRKWTTIHLHSTVFYRQNIALIWEFALVIGDQWIKCFRAFSRPQRSQTWRQHHHTQLRRTTKRTSHLTVQQQRVTCHFWCTLFKLVGSVRFTAQLGSGAATIRLSNFQGNGSDGSRSEWKAVVVTKLW